MLTLYGLVSGLLIDGVTVAMLFLGIQDPWLGDVSFIIPGLFFGLSFAFYFRDKTSGKRVNFVIVSIVAYVAAYIVAFVTALLLGQGFGNASMFVYGVAGFIGGIVGAYIVSLGFSYLISRQFLARDRTMVILIGGILGCVGFILDALLGGADGNLFGFYVLYIIWQTGMAWALGYASKEAKQMPESKEKTPLQLPNQVF